MLEILFDFNPQSWVASTNTFIKQLIYFEDFNVER